MKMILNYSFLILVFFLLFSCRTMDEATTSNHVYRITPEQVKSYVNAMDKAAKFGIDNKIDNNEKLGEKFYDNYNYQTSFPINIMKLDNASIDYKHILNKIYATKNYSNGEDYKFSLLQLEKSDEVLKLKSDEKMIY